MIENCRAIIMAGGEGSRLRPMTCTMPKPMVPLLNKPVIDYCLDLLKNHGITDVTTTLYYLSDAVTTHLQNGDAYGMRITHSVTKEPRGTAGSVKYAMGHEDKKTVIVISGDTLTDCDLSAAMSFHKENKAKITIVLKQVSSPTEYGVALVDEKKRITHFIEKPSRSEVFSNLANTGIYIIEPDIIEKIPDDGEYDFSNDLFPTLLASNVPIYGYETESYWCDIGDIRQYLAAQRDMLDGKVDFETVAKQNGNIFIEDGANISDSTILRGPCYISAGAELGEHVRIDSYSVIGSDVRIFEHTTVKRCVIMKSSTLRENVQIRGSILCPVVHVDAGSSIFEDCVIGEGVFVGKNATIYNTASVWPYKQIYDGQRVTDNIVWGTGKRVFCHDTGITGYCDTDISPETAVRVGAAFAKICKKNATVCIASDGGRMTSMLKRSLISGVISQGTNCYSLPHMPYSLFAFAAKSLGVSGGIYVSSSKKTPHTAHMTICDKSGIAIDTKARRKLQATFGGGEIMPVTYNEIGIVEEIGGTVRAYEAELLSRVDTKRMSEKTATVVLDVPNNIYDIVACALLRVGWSVHRVDSEFGEKLYSEIISQNAAFGCYISDEGVTSLPAFLLTNGKSIQGMSYLATVAGELAKSGKNTNFTLPVTFPDEYSRYLMNNGASVDIAPEEWHAWRRVSHENHNDIPEFFDQIAGILKICEMYAKDTLYQIIEELPEVFLLEETIPCTWDDVNNALQTIYTEGGSDADAIDGVKIHTDKGWVIVKAGNGISSCRIICGSFDEEYASELSKLYIEKLTNVISK